MRVAAKIFQRVHQEELMKYGFMRNHLSLSPLSTPYTVKEYLMMERDAGKYLLYAFALQKAFTILAKPHVNCKNSDIACMVLGAGTGRLIDFCIEAYRRAFSGMKTSLAELPKLKIH